MIARVFQTSTTAGPTTDEERKLLDDNFAAGRQVDGCEGMISIRNPSTGEGLAISLWRDQAAADAYNATSEKLRSDSEQTPGYKTTGPQVYTEVTALL